MNRLITWAGFFGAAGCLIALGVFQFMNPDMTKARLVLTYWPLVAMATFCIIVSFAGEMRRDR